MKQTYSVLRCHAEGEEYRIVQDGYPTRAVALREAKAMKIAATKLGGSWADRFFVCILEAV